MEGKRKIGEEGERAGKREGGRKLSKSMSSANNSVIQYDNVNTSLIHIAYTVFVRYVPPVAHNINNTVSSELLSPLSGQATHCDHSIYIVTIHMEDRSTHT